MPNFKPAIDDSSDVAIVETEQELIPEELVNHIFSFFSPFEVNKQTSVCKAWQAITSSEFLWSAFITKDENKKNNAIKNAQINDFTFAQQPILESVSLFKHSKQARSYQAELARIKDVLEFHDLKDLVDLMNKNELYHRLAMAIFTGHLSREEADTIQNKLATGVQNNKITKQDVLFLNWEQVQGLKEGLSVLDILHWSFASENKFECSWIERTKNGPALREDQEELNRNGGCPIS